MKGKEKCKALKEIRKQIAENNDIKYVVEECKHKGECRGTCPKCEAEVRYLERELEKRRSLGKKVAIAGVSLSVAASFSACSPATVVNTIYDNISDAVFGNIRGGNLGGATTISGDVQYIPDPGEELTGEEAAPDIPPEDDYELMGEPVEIIPEDGYDDEIILDGDVEYVPELEGSEEVKDPDCIESDGCETEIDADEL
ncbi:MAG: hypothetical protein J5840_04430 [Lachnospiraceae bacterium]|nr:hypothetical protein [Lachnospiraceae bacterium]